MAVTEKAKAYHEKMFPGYVSTFLETDPEFIERFDHFTFDEVVNQNDLDDKTSWLLKEGVAAPIAGAAKAFHFDDAVKAVDHELSDEDTAYLEEAYTAHEVVGALSGNVKKTW